MRYENLMENSALIFVKVAYLSASSREIKEEIPKYTGKEELKVLLETTKLANILIKCYSLHSIAQTNSTGTALSFETISYKLAIKPLNA